MPTRIRCIARRYYVISRDAAALVYSAPRNGAPVQVSSGTLAMSASSPQKSAGDSCKVPVGMELELAKEALPENEADALHYWISRFDYRGGGRELGFEPSLTRPTSRAARRAPADQRPRNDMTRAPDELRVERCQVCYRLLSPTEDVHAGTRLFVRW